VAKNLLLSLHLVAVISWMAGILYLFRLVIYHVEEREAVVRSRFEVMERRLYRYITVPAMIVAAGAGLGMIALDPGYYLPAHWLHAKLALVVLLIASTLYAGRSVRRLAAGAPVGGSRHFRVMNEVPTLLMILIVLLVILKPF
jgi:putative membrane protein